MIIAFMLLVALVVSGSVVVALDRNSKGLTALTAKNRAMEQQLRAIERVARDHRDADPIFADVVLAEIETWRRKELEQ